MEEGMRRTAYMAIATLVSFGSLAHAQAVRQTDCQVTWSDATSSCAFEVVKIDKPIVVRTVAGTIANEGGGTWPSGVNVVIELAQSTDPLVRHVSQVVIPSGRFNVEHVAAGEYCFRVGVRPLGWGCVEGRIVVSPTAPELAHVEITVPLGK
jgi:hypothetical protein